MIAPTVGRVVLFKPGKYDDLASTNTRRLAAIVAFVHSDRMVNLSVCDANGNWHSRTSIVLRQPEDEVDENSYCEWMEYQVGQAARTDTLQKQLDEETKSAG